jgi:hypothetical protein
MSTKTTFKRVALVAVASLGFGVLTSVAPATAAANATITSLSAGTPTPVRVGVASEVTITAAHAADATDNTFIVAAKVTTAPSTSKTKSDTNTATLGVTMITGSGTGESLSVANAYAVGGANATVQSTSDTAVSSTFKVRFVADVEGTYTVLVSTGATTYTAGNQTVAVTFTTVGAPTSLTLAKVNGVVTSYSTAASTFGAVYKLTMKDANGNTSLHIIASQEPMPQIDSLQTQAGSEAILRLLVHSRAALDLRNKAGQTPLHISCMHNNISNLNYLFFQGAFKEARLLLKGT